MQCITKVIYKEHHLLEAKEMTFNRKTIVVQEHYEVIVDEISDGRINQQRLWLDGEKKEVAEKLSKLNRYCEVVLVIDVEFFNQSPSKVKILDIINDETEKQQLLNVIKKY